MWFFPSISKFQLLFLVARSIFLMHFEMWTQNRCVNVNVNGRRTHHQSRSINWTYYHQSQLFHHSHRSILPVATFSTNTIVHLLRSNFVCGSGWWRHGDIGSEYCAVVVLYFAICCSLHGHFVFNELMFYYCRPHVTVIQTITVGSVDDATDQWDFEWILYAATENAVRLCRCVSLECIRDYLPACSLVYYIWCIHTIWIINIRK